MIKFSTSIIGKNSITYPTPFKAPMTISKTFESFFQLSQLLVWINIYFTSFNLFYFEYL